MNFVTILSWNFGSGSTSRRRTSPLRGIVLSRLRVGLLRLLCAVLRATLPAILHADGVEGSADDVVADAGQVLHATAANQHDRVLLKVVADTGDVRRDLDAVRQTHT